MNNFIDELRDITDVNKTSEKISECCNIIIEKQANSICNIMKSKIKENVRSGKFTTHINGQHIVNVETAIPLVLSIYDTKIIERYKDYFLNANSKVLDEYGVSIWREEGSYYMNIKVFKETVSNFI